MYIETYEDNERHRILHLNQYPKYLNFEIIDKSSDLIIWGVVLTYSVGKVYKIRSPNSVIHEGKTKGKQRKPFLPQNNIKVES